MQGFFDNRATAPLLRSCTFLSRYRHSLSRTKPQYYQYVLARSSASISGPTEVFGLNILEGSKSDAIARAGLVLFETVCKDCSASNPQSVGWVPNLTNGVCCT